MDEENIEMSILRAELRGYKLLVAALLETQGGEMRVNDTLFHRIDIKGRIAIERDGVRRQTIYRHEVL